MSDLAGLLMAGCCLVLLLVRKLKIRMRYFLAACRSHETVISSHREKWEPLVFSRFFNKKFNKLSAYYYLLNRID